MFTTDANFVNYGLIHESSSSCDGLVRSKDLEDELQT
jgi:hypothetical protein